MSAGVTFRTRGDGQVYGYGVTIEREKHAHNCESPICGADNDLVRVELADRERPRVLCPDHAEDLLARERGWA